MNNISRYRILHSDTVDGLEALINQLNGYKVVNITNGPRLLLALMEYEGGKKGSE